MGSIHSEHHRIQHPTTARERHVILDALRGIALLGIALANYPEFALWTFLSSEQQVVMPTAGVDRVVRFLQYLLIDGKFYTIFSVLFGIGFSLILSRHSVSLFLRRMVILAVIGFCHMMFIWSGDILFLYAVGGLLLSLFIRWSDKSLLWIAAILILLPVGLDALTEFCGVDLAGPFYDAWWAKASEQGITEENFASWLRDADSYPQMFAFLIQGAYERMWEFVSGHRLPKVLGLFILGYLIGKHRYYVRLDKLPLKRLCAWTLAIGFPSSLLYAWSATNDHPWGLTIHSLLYAVSVTPLAFAYITGICLFYKHWYKKTKPAFTFLAASGRMALTNYISQSLIGVLLFYGLGMGLGTSMGLVSIELIALVVFFLLMFLSRLWLRFFLFGPLEWIWRMLTYGRYFKFISPRNIASLIVCLMIPVFMSAQDIESFVNKQLESYPKSRLLDIYKSCFQDYMGAEHLVSDRQRVKDYLDEELETISDDAYMPWYYEPCGIEGNYVRVSLRTVKQNLITEDMLLDAFIRSANGRSNELQPNLLPTVESWRERWNEIVSVIDQMQINLPNYEKDKQFIDSILSVGKYAISHSPEYREAYHPHYRIVERGIFEREIKPLIE